MISLSCCVPFIINETSGGFVVSDDLNGGSFLMDVCSWRNFPTETDCKPEFSGRNASGIECQETPLHGRQVKVRSSHH